MSGQSVDAVNSTLSNLGRAAVEQGRPFEELLSEASIEAPAYRSLPNAPPLAFMHVPKTAGGAVTEWLKSMFDADDIAPYATSHEFQRLRADPRKYRLFAGHILGSQVRAFLPDDVTLFMIIRDPLERAVSEYYWIPHMYESSKLEWEKIIKNVPALSGERNYMLEAGELFEKIDFATALAADSSVFRYFFRDALLRQFGWDQREKYDAPIELADGDPGLKAIRSRQLERAVGVMDRLAIVGEYANLYDAMLLLAATRGWPAPPPLRRVHDLGAPTRKVAADASLREAYRARNPIDYQLYELARDKAETVRSQLEVICGEASSSAVDRHHLRRYFETAPRVPGFTVDAGAPKNGFGWELPQSDGAGGWSRPITRSVSLLALLDAGCGDYRLFCHFVHFSSLEVLQSVNATVGGKPLERVSAMWRPWAKFAHKCYVVEWHLPGELVAEQNGKVEIKFLSDLLGPADALRFGTIGCVPV